MEPDFDVLCTNANCRELIVRGYQLPEDVLGFNHDFLKIPPLDTLVFGNESATLVRGLPVMETELLCSRCRSLLGSLYYHLNMLGTRDNDDEDYLFRIGSDRVLHLLRLRFELSADQFEEVLEPLMGGVDEGQRARHDKLKKQATHYHDDDL